VFVTSLTCPSQRGSVLCPAIPGPVPAPYHAPSRGPVPALFPVRVPVPSVVHARDVHARGHVPPQVVVSATPHVHARVPSQPHDAAVPGQSPDTNSRQ